jgi:hypothetical protein
MMSLSTTVPAAVPSVIQTSEPVLAPTPETPVLLLLKISLSPSAANPGTW